mgnify:CR=1 FL=1
MIKFLTSGKHLAFTILFSLLYTVNACPKNSRNWDNSTDLDLLCICDPGFTSYVENVGCTACPGGSYKEIQGNSDCIQCTANSFSVSGSSNASTDCACNPGFTHHSTKGCISCHSGSFKSHSGKEACISCLAGKFSTTTRQKSLINCFNCPPFMSSISGSSSCSCLAGYTGDYAQENDECDACLIGTYKSSNSTTSCISCGIGKYSTTLASTSCYICPQHSSTTTIGSVSPLNCTCTLGYTDSGGGICEACSKSSIPYKNNAGKHECMYYDQTPEMCGRYVRFLFLFDFANIKKISNQSYIYI